MSFDGLVMAAVKNELKETVVGGRIEKIYQPLIHEIVLIIHSGKTRYRLLVSADARDARVHLTQRVRENPLTPPIFCMVLRKHLEGGRIFDITQLGLERVLQIRVEAVDELGMLSEKILICEVMGKHSNVVLVNPAENTILDGITRYSYATSRHREILPGRRYIPPPETGKIDPLDAAEETFRQAMWDPDRDSPVDKLILDKFNGFSPQTCREIAARAGLDPGTSNQSLGEIELNNLWKAFRCIRDCAVSGKFEPVVCFRDNLPAAFSAVGLTEYTEGQCRSGRISEVLDEFFTVREDQEKFKQGAANLQKVVSREIKKVQKKKTVHEETLRKAKDAENLKILGELITANIFQLSEGIRSAELVNFYDPAGKTVSVELDPQLTPAKNAQLYFKRYTKARSSKVAACKYIDEATTELAYLESVIVALEQAENPGDLVDIRAELLKEGYLKPEKSLRETKKLKPTSEPKPLQLTSGDGFEILVGRNNRQNDYLTMKLARPDDMWLHVKDIPGAHVIVRGPTLEQIPSPVLQQAAEIAAYYSKARLSSKVPVDYTLKKHVRKPKGAKPGMVIYDNQKTVYVEPRSDSQVRFGDDTHPK